MNERTAGHPQQAAEIIAEASTRFTADPEVQLLAAESLLLDSKNPQGAVDALKQVQVPEKNRFLGFRRATLLADAYQATGQKDLAIAELESVPRRSRTRDCSGGSTS